VKDIWALDAIKGPAGKLCYWGFLWNSVVLGCWEQTDLGFCSAGKVSCAISRAPAHATTWLPYVAAAIHTPANELPLQNGIDGAAIVDHACYELRSNNGIRRRRRYWECERSAISVGRYGEQSKECKGILFSLYVQL
jgi:hypothetical protein